MTASARDLAIEAVLVARCENVTEPDGTPCPGRLRYHWGQSDAACDTCGGRCGIAVANWEGIARNLRALAGEAGAPDTPPADDVPAVWWSRTEGVITAKRDAYRDIHGYDLDELPSDAVRIVPAAAPTPADDAAGRDWRITNPAHAPFCDGSCDAGASVCPNQARRIEKTRAAVAASETIEETA